MKNIEWQVVDQVLDTLHPAEGGYTSALRGTVELPDGDQAFVKIAQTEDEKNWINKERQVYNWLAKQSYSAIPELIAENDGGMLLADLSHLDWSPTWTEQKLDLAISALEDLASLSEPAQQQPFFTSSLMDLPNGWQELAASGKTTDLVSPSQVATFAQQTADFDTGGNTLIHGDIRSDNLAYDAENNKVYIVDWNWAEIGSVSLDLTAFLVSVKKSGFDIPDRHRHLISADDALFLAGFWLYSGNQPPPRDDDRARQLRIMQLESAKVALQFYNQLQTL
jgi:thiamine kinase-like enzyme